jgi:magnesium transporter
MGYIGLWELLKLKDRTKTLGEMAHHHVVSATVDMDQERVGHLMSKYDLSALPVVDTQQRLVGRITWDDVMDVMEDEASEDLFLFAGSDDAELDYASPLQACKVRLPWLLITLGAGFITSTILKRFMLDLSQVFALSFFVPIVLAMGGNTGIQSSTLIIRGLAVGALEGRGITKLLGRELAAGAIMGVFCGLIMGIWAHILISFSPGQGTEFSPLYLAFTVGLALFAAMSFAAIFGAFVPIVLNRAEIDPAVASGPFVTASNDILALLIYYGVAIALIGLYGQVGGALS